MIRQKYNAIVKNNDDPKRMGRIRVVCGELVGQNSNGDERELPYWVEPANFCLSAEVDKDSGVGAGTFFVPEVGTRVILEIIRADPRGDELSGEAMLLHPQPRYYAAPYSPVFAPGPDFVSGDTYPRVRGLRTTSGHTVLFDDNEPTSSISIKHANGQTVILMDADGTVSILAGTQSYVTIPIDGTVTIHAPNIKLDAAATQALVRGNDLLTWLNGTLKTWLNNHIHPTGVGPSGTPTVQAQDTPSTVLSTKHKVD
jgi:hypothetical protein